MTVGWLAHAEGDESRAVRLLLERGRASEALAAYEAALADSPKRLNGLAGAGPAAEIAGDRARARSHYAELLALCGPAKCERPVAQRAAAFVAGK